MPICKKCSNDVSKVYDCVHTDDEEYCKECYTELHYYLTKIKIQLIKVIMTLWYRN